MATCDSILYYAKIIMSAYSLLNNKKRSNAPWAADPCRFIQVVGDDVPDITLILFIYKHVDILQSPANFPSFIVPGCRASAKATRSRGNDTMWRFTVLKLSLLRIRLVSSTVRSRQPSRALHRGDIWSHRSAPIRGFGKPESLYLYASF